MCFSLEKSEGRRTAVSTPNGEQKEAETTTRKAARPPKYEAQKSERFRFKGAPKTEAEETRNFRSKEAETTKEAAGPQKSTWKSYA